MVPLNAAGPGFGHLALEKCHIQSGVSLGASKIALGAKIQGARDVPFTCIPRAYGSERVDFVPLCGDTPNCARELSH